MCSKNETKFEHGQKYLKTFKNYWTQSKTFEHGQKIFELPDGLGINRYHHNLRFCIMGVPWDVPLVTYNICLDWDRFPSWHYHTMKSSWFSPSMQLVPMELIRWHWVVFFVGHTWTLHTSPLITRPLSGSNDQGMLC